MPSSDTDTLHADNDGFAEQFAGFTPEYPKYHQGCADCQQHILKYMIHARIIYINDHCFPALTMYETQVLA